MPTAHGFGKYLGTSITEAAKATGISVCATPPGQSEIVNKKSNWKPTKVGVIDRQYSASDFNASKASKITDFYSFAKTYYPEKGDEFWIFHNGKRQIFAVVTSVINANQMKIGYDIPVKNDLYTELVADIWDDHPGEEQKYVMQLSDAKNFCLSQLDELLRFLKDTGASVEFVRKQSKQQALKPVQQTLSVNQNNKQWMYVAGGAGALLLLYLLLRK